MLILLSQIQRDMSRFIFHVIFLGLVALLVGISFPWTYYHYFDSRDYIRFSNPITFDKKEYGPCEKMTAVVRFRSDISTDVSSSVRLLRVNSDNSYTPIKTYNSKPSFVNKTKPQGVLYRITFKLPCELSPGTYVFDGVYRYSVRGVSKNYAFTTTQIQIVSKSQPLTFFFSSPGVISSTVLPPSSSSLPVAQTTNNYTFEAVPAPTETPAPTPQPTPQPTQNSGVQIGPVQVPLPTIMIKL